ncbi:MAG: hypothetical protein HOP23_16330 [Methylococcaceae bacterium]|nr:hypothetical protein [Methylococcaceae bacterium]
MITTASAYPSVLLGDVCRFIGGGTPSRKRDDYFNGNIPWATVKDFKTFRIFDTEDHISEAGLADSASNLVPAGTVLLVTRVGLGKVAIAEQSLAINQDIKAVIPTPEIIPEFLFWFLLSKGSEIERMGAGATVKGVTLNDVRSIKMPLPPLDEQRRIVDILSRADGIIRLRREAQKKTAEIIPALFFDTFGDPATNPKEWDVVSLSEICGKCLTHDPRKQPDDTFFYIDITAIDNQRGRIANTKVLLGADAPSRARQIVRVGDILVSTVRPNLRGSAFVPIELDGQICSTGFCVLRPLNNATSAFIYALVRSDWFVGELIQNVRGAQYPAVSDKDVFSLTLPLPPLDLQNSFAEVVEQIRSIQSQQFAATAKAEAAFEALLGHTFREGTL